jgi:hypothetical protein
MTRCIRYSCVLILFSLLSQPAFSQDISDAFQQARDMVRDWKPLSQGRSQSDRDAAEGQSSQSTTSEPQRSIPRIDERKLEREREKKRVQDNLQALEQNLTAAAATPRASPLGTPKDDVATISARQMQLETIVSTHSAQPEEAPVVLTESAAALISVFERASRDLNLPKGPATGRELADLNCQAFFRAVGNELADSHSLSWADDFKNMNADQIARELSREADSGGNWQRVEADKAQSIVNGGEVVVGASMADASGHGHIGFVFPIPSTLDSSKFDGTGPFVRDGNEHDILNKIFPSTWGAVKASKAFALSRK